MSRVATQSNGAADQLQAVAKLLTSQIAEMHRFIDRLLTEMRAA